MKTGTASGQVAKRRPFWLAAALMATALAGLDGHVAHAATAQNIAAPAQASAQKFNIPAQKLGDALASFGAQSGWQVSVRADVIRNATSPGVNGSLTPADALSRLLAGTGFTYRLSGGHTVTLVPASANITLGPVRVGGVVAHESPTGPGVGYVATNTMTGSKTDTPIIEIPNSIHVITKQQMIDQQPQNVMEALRYTPGVSVEGLGSYSNGLASGQNNGSIIQRGFPTSQFVDGLRSYSNSTGETAFLERIEVMNGPASVLYGQTTPGGMISMNLKKPTATPLHNATLGFGNWGRYEATVDISDKITKSGSVRYRVAAIGVTQGTQTDHIDYHRVGVLPSITWDIDKQTVFTLLGSYMYTPGSGTNSMQLPPGVLLNINNYGRIPRSRFLGDTGFNKSSGKEAMLEYQFRHSFNRWIDFSQNLRWERSETSAEDMVRDGGMITPYVYGRMGQKSENVNSTIGLDSRVGGKFSVLDTKNTWIVGTDFRQLSSSGNSLSDWTPGHNGFPGEDGMSPINVYNPQSNYVPCFNIHSSTCLNRGSQTNATYFQEGIYFQDQIKYKNLSIIVGGRQDWINYHGYSESINNINESHTYTEKRSGKLPRPQSAFTWRGGVVYHFKFGLAPYFSYSTSFVPQSAGQRNWEGKLFSPLTGKQLEAGLKYESSDHNIFLTAAAFRIDENHYLVSDPVHDNFSSDAGEVRSEGFELSAHANLTHDLRVMASYTFDKAIYLNSNLSDNQDFPNGAPGALVAEKGKFIENTPRNMVSAFLDYTVPETFIRGVGFNWGIRYTGFTYSDAVNSFKVPAYVLFDIGAHYDLGEASPLLKGLRMQLAVSNLTNKYYVTSCGGTYSCYLGQARRVYGNLSYNW